MVKSKMEAYVLWFFFGLWGAHKFYLGKIGMGIAYIFTFGFLGVGLIVDLFTLSRQVDQYNEEHPVLPPPQPVQSIQPQNIVVNVTAPVGPGSAPVALPQLSPEKKILSLTSTSDILTIKQIVAQTDLEIEEAEEALKKLVSKGIAREQIDADGKVRYDFS